MTAPATRPAARTLWGNRDDSKKNYQTALKGLKTWLLEELPTEERIRECRQFLRVNEVSLFARKGVGEQQLSRLLEIVSQSNPALIIAPHCAGGLLLEGRYYNDIVFPGGSLILGSQFVCCSVRVMGRIQLLKVADGFQRQQSRQHRIEGIEAIQRILKMPDPEHRACLVVNLICRRVGLAAARTLSPEAVGQLVFTSPEQVIKAYHSYEKSLSGLAKSGRLARPDVLSWQRRLHEEGRATQAQPAHPVSSPVAVPAGECLQHSPIA